MVLRFKAAAPQPSPLPKPAPAPENPWGEATEAFFHGDHRPGVVHDALMEMNGKLNAMGSTMRYDRWWALQLTTNKMWDAIKEPKKLQPLLEQFWLQYGHK